MIGLIDYNTLDPANTPDAIRSVPAGASVTQLPSGNSLLVDNGIGIGAGTEQTKGSGEIYQVGPDGAQHWIGQKASGELERAYDQYANYAGGVGTGVSQAAYDAANTKTSTILGGAQIQTGPAAGSIASQAGAASTQYNYTPEQIAAGEKDAMSQISSVFSQTGGAAAWGMSEAEFAQTFMNEAGSFSQGTYWGIES